MNLRTRTGKIAALPEGIRAELNQRLADGEQEPQLLPWLNDLPEVRQVLAERFGGKPIVQQNLSAWRRGGFRDWQFAREHAADTRHLMGLMMEQAKAAGVDVLQTAAAAASVHLMQVFSDLTEVIRGKAGEIKNAKLKMKNSGGGEVKSERASTVSSAEPAKVKSGGMVETAPSPPPSPGSFGAPSWPSPPVGARGMERRVASTEDCLQGPVPVGSAKEEGEGGEAGRRDARPTSGEEEEQREHYSLMDRTVLICRAVSGIGVLGRLRQGETRLQLQRERLAQTGKLVEIRGEEKDLKVLKHKEASGAKKTKTQGALRRPRKGGLPKKAMLALAREIKLL